MFFSLFFDDCYPDFPEPSRKKRNFVSIWNIFKVHFLFVLVTFKNKIIQPPKKIGDQSNSTSYGSIQVKRKGFQYCKY